MGVKEGKRQEREGTGPDVTPAPGSFLLVFFSFSRKKKGEIVKSDVNDPSAGSPTDTLLRLLLLLDNKAGWTLPNLTSELPPKCRSSSEQLAGSSNQ